MRVSVWVDGKEGLKETSAEQAWSYLVCMPGSPLEKLAWMEFCEELQEKGIYLYEELVCIVSMLGPYGHDADLSRL